MLALVIEQFRLRLRILNIVFELAADDRVAEGDCQAAGEEVGGMLNESSSDLTHCNIKHARITLDREGTVTVDLCELH